MRRARPAPLQPSVAPPMPMSKAAVLWDVDGTLVESTKLAFCATNEVLVAQGYAQVELDSYKVGCRFATPERFNFHIGAPSGSEQGAQLGRIFDSLYVARVSPQTTALFEGIRATVDELAAAAHPQGALSNACGEYVRAVVAAHPEALGKFGVALGADEVPAAKPDGAGLEHCCRALEAEPNASVYVGDSPTDGKAARAAGMRSVGVGWGANTTCTLSSDFDVVVSTVPELASAIREQLRIAAGPD